VLYTSVVRRRRVSVASNLIKRNDIEWGNTSRVVGELVSLPRGRSRRNDDRGRRVSKQIAGEGSKQLYLRKIIFSEYLQERSICLIERKGQLDLSFFLFFFLLLPESFISISSNFTCFSFKRISLTTLDYLFTLLGTTRPTLCRRSLKHLKVTSLINHYNKCKTTPYYLLSFLRRENGVLGFCLMRERERERERERRERER
jgi:hypothetical protein